MMAMQLGATRAALLEAGASPASADKAAEELASYETRFSTLESDMKLVKWMIGTNIGLTLAVVGKLFLVH